MGGLHICSICDGCTQPQLDVVDFFKCINKIPTPVLCIGASTDIQYLFCNQCCLNKEVAALPI